MKALLSLLLLSVAVAGSAAEPHTLKIPSSDGEWTLALPAKPDQSNTRELKLPAGQTCVETSHSLDIKNVSMLSVLHVDCPDYEIPAHERQQFFDRMLPDVEEMSANRPGETQTRKIAAQGFTGQEVRKQYAILEVALRTFVGKHSVLRLTAMWKPAESAGVAAAERFLKPL